MKFIQDKEINLKETDSLNSKSYSETLTNTIKSVPNGISFTIGLFGEWGSGKSSIIETSKLEIEAYNDKKIKFIVYDAWKYANDSFRRMFLLKIQECLNFDKSDYMQSFYANQSEDVSINNRLNWKKVGVLSAIMILGILLIFLIPDTSIDYKISIGVIISFLGLLVRGLLKAVDEYKINIQKPHLFAPEQFEECFNSMISKSVKGYSPIQQAMLWVKGEKFEKNIDKLVIVIDNIDRCDRKTAYELLTDTKSFLGESKNVIFLIPVDDQALIKHIVSSYNSNRLHEAEEFLRKFFNVTIRIKPLKPIELYEFANRINIQNELGFNPDTIDIVSNEYATNPRRIIQFFNNLSTELNHFLINHNENFVNKYESLICKFLIIREEWPEYYRLISNYPHLVNSTNESKTKVLERNLELKLFLDKTRAISNRIDVNILERLLSNDKVFEKLTNDVRNYVIEQEVDKINELITNDELSKDEVINYALDQLTKGIVRKAYGTQVSRTFGFLLKFSNIDEFTTSVNYRIQNVVEEELDNIINRINDMETFIKYVDLLHKQEFKYMTNKLHSTINDGLNKEEDVADEANELEFLLIKSLVEFTDYPQLLEKIGSSFTFYFEHQESTLEELVPNEKIKHIVTKSLLEYILSKIEDLREDSKWFNDLNYIFSNYRIPYDQHIIVFKRFNDLYPNFNSKASPFMIGIIQKLSTLFSHLQFRYVNNETKTFIEKIFNNRNVNGRNIKLLDEISSNAEYVESVVKLLEKVYRASGAKISTVNYFKKIAEYDEENRNIINKSFLNLKNNCKFKLTHVSDVILTDTSHSEENLELLDHIFKLKDDDGNYKIDTTKISSKVKELAIQIFEETEASERIKAFFENLINEKPVTIALSEVIKERSKDEILMLSDPLLKLAFDKITDGSELLSYQDNLDLLKAIGEGGSKAHIIKLTKVIVTKLLKEETYQDGFDIIEVTSGFNNSDSKTLISHLETISNDEEYRETANNLIEKIKSK